MTISESSWSIVLQEGVASTFAIDMPGTGIVIDAGLSEPEIVKYGITRAGQPPFGASTAGDEFIWTPPNGSAGIYGFYLRSSSDNLVVVALVLFADSGDDGDLEPADPAIVEFNGAYCLKSITTDNETWNLGGGISAAN